MNIMFEFVGGPLDGKTVLGRVGGQDEADRYYALTHHGRVGQRFRIASTFAIEILAEEELKEETPHHFQPHSYEVTDRIEEGNEVLVRVEYVEKDTAEAAPAAVRAHLEPTPQPVDNWQTVHQFLQRTARSMRQSYSHCWPVDPQGQHDLARCNITLHFAHVLLNANFSVFANAVHPLDEREGVDLLGIAPSQDWFLACKFSDLAGAQDVKELLANVLQLEKFWLSPRLTIKACRGHMARIADHCQRGYGVLAGLHCALGGTELLELWKTRRVRGDDADRFVQRMSCLHAKWAEPLVVRDFEDRGTFYLLYAVFPIPR